MLRRLGGQLRGPAHDRRAALAVGPDVWEIVARLRELDGPEEQRIAVLSEEANPAARSRPACPITARGGPGWHGPANHGGSSPTPMI
jgi:hypothetical protein